MRTEIPICATGVGKHFGQGIGKITALDNVDISLHAGQMTLLRGPSGSGKSSLVAALGGLQPPDEGSIKVFGEEIWGRGERHINRYRREHCGFVFQTVGLFPALSAIEQIALPLTYMGHSVKEAKARAQRALDEVGLGDRGGSLPGEMSGGQNQRVAIARMLAKNPKIIFCDEPTSALDRENGVRVAELLQTAAHNHNAVVLCVTHDDRLIPFADRVLDIEDGRILPEQPAKAPRAKESF